MIDSNELSVFLREALGEKSIIQDKSKPNDTDSPMNQIRIHAMSSVDAIVSLNAHKGGRYLKLTIQRPQLDTGGLKSRVVWSMGDISFSNN